MVAANHNSIFALDAKDGKKIWELHSRKAEEVGWSKYHVIRNGSSPAIADGKVFIGSDDGYLYIIDIKTGKKLQEINVGCPIKASVIVAENFVCVSDFNGRIYAFNSK